MKHCFIDTNILIDYAGDRKPFSDAAEKLFLAAEARKIKLYCSSLSFTTVYYILSKFSSELKARKILREYLEVITVIEVNQEHLKVALDLPFRDYEDAVQYQCAFSHSKVELIVTRNKKDYKNSSLLLVSPDALISFYQ